MVLGANFTNRQFPSLASADYYSLAFLHSNTVTSNLQVRIGDREFLADVRQWVRS